MIASRVWPSAMPLSTKIPAASGPRWARAPFIPERIWRASGPGAVKPAMPHTLPPSRGRLLAPRRRALDDAADFVGRLAAPLEIDPRLHLGHDPEQNEQHARQAERRRQQG